MNTPLVALKHARTTFQRLSDAKFFNGWIRDISPDTVVAQTRATHHVQIDDEFSFHVFGSGKDAFFHARLVVAQGVGNRAIFSSHRPGEQTTELVCNLTTEMAFKAESQRPRFCVEGASADITAKDGTQTAGATIIDIGKEGFAAMTGQHISKGDLVSVDLYVRALHVVFEAQVRNCISYGPEPHFQRTGLKIAEIDRLNKVKWDQLYRTIIEANRINWATDGNQYGPVFKLKARKVA